MVHLFRLLASLSPSRVIDPSTITYASLESHKSDLSIDVLILISLFGLLFFFMIDHRLQSIF